LHLRRFLYLGWSAWSRRNDRSRSYRSGYGYRGRLRSLNWLRSRRRSHRYLRSYRLGRPGESSSIHLTLALGLAELEGFGFVLG
jgi:hypothetical protein